MLPLKLNSLTFSNYLLSNLPYMPCRICEGSGSDTPWPIHWTVKQGNAACFQFAAYCIYIIQPDSKLEPRSGFSARDCSRMDQTVGFGDIQEVNAHISEIEHRRNIVLINSGKTKDFLIEHLHIVQILHKQCNYINIQRP